MVIGLPLERREAEAVFERLAERDVAVPAAEVRDCRDGGASFTEIVAGLGEALGPPGKKMSNFARPKLSNFAHSKSLTLRVDQHPRKIRMTA